MSTTINITEDYAGLRDYYMNQYNETSSNVDDGKGKTPSSVYCMINQVEDANGDYHRSRYTKLGKAVSAPNRYRSYCQSGNIPLMYWAVDIRASSAYLSQLENNLHVFAGQYKTYNVKTNSTELFDLTNCCPYDDILYPWLEQLPEYLSRCIVNVNRFDKIDPNSISTQTLYTHQAQNGDSEIFNNLFDEVHG